MTIWRSNLDFRFKGSYPPLAHDNQTCCISLDFGVIIIQIQRRIMLFVYIQNLNTPTFSLNFFSLHQLFHSFYFLLQIFFLLSISGYPKCLSTPMIQKNISIQRLFLVDNPSSLTNCKDNTYGTLGPAKPLNKLFRVSSASEIPNYNVK